MALPHEHRVTALPRIYGACLFFLGMFAQTAAHIPALRGCASAFPARVLQWPVNYGEISLLVVQLFLINLNIYTESRLLSRAALVAYARSCVVPGAVAAKFHPCLCGIHPCLPEFDPCLPKFLPCLPGIHPCLCGIHPCPGCIPVCAGSILAQPAWVILVRGADTQSLH